MADDQDKSQKTETATPHKLIEARKKGDVAKSQEIPSWVLLAVSVLVLAVFSGPLARNLSGWLSRFFSNPRSIELDAQGIQVLALSIIDQMFALLAMIIGLLVVAALSGHLMQQGFLWAPDKVQPKLSKISPLAGFKRVFGAQGLVNFAKGVGKMALVGLVAFAVVWPRRELLSIMPYLDILTLMPMIRDAAVILLLASVSVFALIAIADYLYQKHTFLERMKMSRKDVRDEMKNTEGDPHVRARLRQIRSERSKQRMMQAVPDASVVIVNPTHYAVALKYEQGEAPAPVCVALGVDDVALRIRQIAEENDVPIVENPPLARALHATSELDHEIPEEHFKAVAKILGFVLSRRKAN